MDEQGLGCVAHGHVLGFGIDGDALLALDKETVSSGIAICRVSLAHGKTTTLQELVQIVTRYYLSLGKFSRLAVLISNALVQLVTRKPRY